MLEAYRGEFERISEPLVNLLVRVGLTPNMLSLTSFILAAASGILFYLSGSPDSLRFLLFAAICMALSSLLDAMDGAVARRIGEAGRKGDLLDHVLDRYADLFILCGISFGGFAPAWIGVLAITGVLLTSYMGTQAQAVGIGRYYGGILGRADRLILLLGSTIANRVYPAAVYGLPILGWVLVIFAITGHLTAIQRFIFIWRRIE
ncbi:MAG TPA: CDP-alcohol phosphatidyltransferase family protein [Candidatus Syntrophoarchaeum butanivorans]|uniref:CDP-alcohol phosphatidyltransferase family protein n=1 Tax=Candidatus Syntropharchaeum butanivorans TaxID=1839936 RepID=A0A7C0X1J8_9EURY|nr:CDP-alcohol phosphatidyltransferase family protein [Candidatus Syntrophoarchaeum butanivorans]